MNRVKYYDTWGKCTIIYIKQTTHNLLLNTNDPSRSMTLREAEFYTKKAGLSRRKPRINRVVSSSGRKK